MSAVNYSPTLIAAFSSQKHMGQACWVGLIIGLRYFGWIFMLAKVGEHAIRELAFR